MIDCGRRCASSIVSAYCRLPDTCGDSMNEMATDDVETVAWLLRGITGNLPGILSLANGRFTFVTDDGQIVFDAPVSDARDVKVPWYYFGGGMKLSVGTERY